MTRSMFLIERLGKAESRRAVNTKQSHLRLGVRSRLIEHGD